MDTSDTTSPEPFCSGNNSLAECGFLKSSKQLFPFLIPKHIFLAGVCIPAEEDFYEAFS
jgi:hypothetical protein